MIMQSADVLRSSPVVKEQQLVSRARARVRVHDRVQLRVRGGVTATAACQSGRILKKTFWKTLQRPNTHGQPYTSGKNTHTHTHTH